MAWEQLIARYKRLVYAVPRRSGLDEDLAAEVFQTVFVKLLERINHIEQPERISAWLVTTARRETWRTSKRERAASAAVSLDADDEDEQSDISDDAPTLDELVLRFEEAQIIRTAIGSLGERCRALITLLFYHPNSPSYAQIGAALGVKEGSIGQIRARCLQKLLNVLDAMGWK
jgi:RNA polymerase sigma factor (sigma-70 family)